MLAPKSTGGAPTGGTRSDRSCPEQNARPAPVRINTRAVVTSGLHRASLISPSMLAVSAFNLAGRLSIRRAIPLSTSRLMDWCDIWYLLLSREVSHQFGCSLNRSPLQVVQHRAQAPQLLATAGASR